MTKKQNPSGPVDKHAAEELEGYIDNDEPLHRKWVAIVKNLKKHQNRGNYETERAIDGFMYLVDDGAKKYAKEFGGGKWNDMFNANTRRSVAVSYVHSFEHGERDEDKMLNPRKYKQGALRGSTLGVGKDWHLIIEGPRGVFSTTGWRSRQAAKREGDKALKDLPYGYHYRVEYVGRDPDIRKHPDANPGKRHMACGDLSKKRCDQLNDIYESSRGRGYSKKRSAQIARGTVRKQVAKDKRKKRRSNPAHAAVPSTSAMRDLAQRLVEGG